MTNIDAGIHTRALLVVLTISTWTARKYDRVVSNKVNAEYNASTDAGRYNKFLLPGDAQSYKELVTIASSIRAQHYTQTLAWSDEGRRLLTTANYMPYADWYRNRQREFRTALDAFVADYPALRSQAATKLNGLYRDEDYPSIADIRSRFALSVEYWPLPAQGDVRVDLAADQIAAIEANVANTLQQAVQLAASDAWQRLYKVVSCIQERLSQPDAIFRDSLIGNAREVCDILQRLNVTNDPELERMRARVAAELTEIDPDILRDTPRVRANVAAKADAILKSMSGIFQAA